MFRLNDACHLLSAFPVFALLAPLLLVTPSLFPCLPLYIVLLVSIKHEGSEVRYTTGNGDDAQASTRTGGSSPRQRERGLVALAAGSPLLADVAFVLRLYVGLRHSDG